jgi:hypothetical protein
LSSKTNKEIRMGTTSELITRPAARILGLAQGLVGDVPADRFARLPVVDGVPVETNHAAFVLGHLALYPGRVLGLLGVEDTDLRTPAGYEDLFGPGAACEDDPDGSVYPHRDQIVGVFSDLHERGLAVVESLPDAAFDREIEEDRYRAMFGNAGAAASFMFGAHLGFHLGQLSAWRRAMGLKSVM